MVPWCKRSQAGTAVRKESAVWYGTLLPSVLSVGEEQFWSSDFQKNTENEKNGPSSRKQTYQEGKNCGRLLEADENTVIISQNVKDATKVLNVAHIHQGRTAEVVGLSCSKCNLG